jgi:hypothetical protein
MMGLRFRRSLRILPGLRLNLGKRGASVSIGGRGAHVTLGHGQVRETVGLPGTGLSYTHVDGAHKTAAKAPEQALPAGAENGHPSARRPSLPSAIARLVVFVLMLAIVARVIWLLR